MLKGFRRSVVAAAAAVGVLAHPAAATAQDRVPIRGRVVEAGAGVPVVGAEVRLLGSGAVVTGADGSWHLASVSVGEHRLFVHHVGYADAVLRVAVDDDGVGEIVVALTPRPLSLDAVVVTASRRLQRLGDAPVATEVLDRSRLREIGAPDLSAALVEQTGIVLEGGHPVGAGIALQGLGSERVLVLVDGQPFIGRIAGGLDLSRIPVAMIERVEVVKGPQSTLYGSEAMGGVVNVITRPPEGGAWRGGVDLTGGTHGRLDAGVHALGGIGPLGITADVGRRAIELVPGHAGEAGSLVTRWDGAARLGWSIDSTRSVGASALVLDERQRWSAGPLYHFVDNVQWGARLDGVWRGGRHRLSPTLYATEFRHLSRRATTPEPVAGTGEEEVQRLIEAELLYALDLGGVDLDAGIEARREAIRSDRVLGADRALHTLEPFVQLSWSGERWAIVPGARLSWSEQWGTHWTPRIAALFRPVPRLALRAAVGQGYRAPGFKELFIEFLNAGGGIGYVVRGMPTLRPETSRNLTASVEWVGDHVVLRGQLFRNRFDDFIETRLAGDSSGYTVYTYGNIDDGTTRGAELEVGTAWRGLRAEAGYAFLEAERAGTGEPLLGRPAHTARASMSYATPFGLRVGATALVTGTTPVRIAEAGVVERGGFSRFDLRIAQALPGGFETTLGIENLADVRPADWPGFMGRQLFIGIAWRGERTTRSARAGDDFGKD